MTAHTLSGIARAIGGRVVGNRVNGPGPGHSPGDNSLWVGIAPHLHGGIWVKTFSTADEDLACKDYVLERLGYPAWLPRPGNRAPRSSPVPVEPDRDEQRKAAWVRSRVREIWHEAHDPRGTIVQKYLHGRFLDLSDDIAVSVIRFHPKCPWREDEEASLIYVPAMICAMRDIATDEIKAIHRRRLTPDGQKVGKPKMYGPARGAVVKIDPDDAVNLGLVLSEGVETALSARQFGYAPAWAAGSAGAIKNFPVLGGVEGLTLAAEEDNSGANALAIEACRDRWHAAGRDVLVLASRIGGDLNNALTGVRP